MTGTARLSRRGAPHFLGHIAPKTTIVWPGPFPSPETYSALPPQPPLPPLTKTPELNSTPHLEGTPLPPPSGEVVAAYGRMERVHRSHGYHRRAHGAIGGANVTNAPPPAPTPSPSLTTSCSNHPPTQPVCLPAALAARYELVRAARTHGADPLERGVISTPPPLLKHSPQEARYKEGV